MKLYHYYDCENGPFQNISELSDEEAQAVIERIKVEKPNTMCAKRNLDYVEARRRFESILRVEFLRKGGIIERQCPHYMVVEKCPWLEQWFEHCEFIEIDVKDLDLRKVSFTYGDSHPTFSDKVTDGKEYRKRLYTYEEILKVIEKYGLPQVWNSDGRYGPERYVEAHIWTDEGIK